MARDADRSLRGFFVAISLIGAEGRRLNERRSGKMPAFCEGVASVAEKARAPGRGGRGRALKVTR
jgi:hypothetical protein